MSKLYEKVEWKKYRKKGTTEMRPVDRHDILTGELPVNVSISQTDKENGSPKPGDMIARNPEDINDQWLVAKEYFYKNYEPIKHQYHRSQLNTIADKVAYTLENSLGECVQGNEYRIRPIEGQFWIEHKGAGSSEPLWQWIETEVKQAINSNFNKENDV